MAESVVSFVVERIGDLLLEEGNFLAGVSAQVRQLQEELRRMLCFLEDVDKRQDESKSVRGWVSDIRELAYDAENVIETFALQVASRRENGFRNKCKRYATIFIEGAHVHKVGMEIEAIQDRIIKLTRSLTTYGIQFKNDQGSTSLQQKLRRTYSHLVEEHTFGLDNDVKILATKLRDERRGVGEIVSICGMGGLGKTTLANKLYHHVSVRGHFEALAWHCVSQQFQAREVWEGILVKLVSPSKEKREEISKMKDDEIAKELYLLQQKVKCLVVLDDIWTTDAWDLLKPAFPIGKAVGGSKIVLTTRNKTLAIHGSPSAYIHQVQFLNEHDSWELFQTKTIFPNKIDSGFKFNMGIEKLGMEIVKKCAGLPLAIIVLGGLLATKKSFGEWEKVYKTVDLYLMRGEGTDKKYSVVNGVLNLSYNELPYHLKPCFLHLGHFPEDYDIPCKTLVKIWTTEGFVSQCEHVREENETMEDVAEQYLHDLIDRSIVQVSQTLLNGKVKTCHLHDLMRDFCLTKATQEKYLKVVRATNLNEKPSPNRVPRLAVHRDDVKDIDLGYYAKTPNLRSIFLMCLRGMDGEYPRIKSWLSYFKFLKVLSFERCRIEKGKRNEIGSLIHLRYLAFEKCEIDALPSSIGNLKYLQTLIVRPHSFTITEVPNVLWKLEQLRHLILKRCHIKGFGEKSLKLGNLKELQTLECNEFLFSVSNIDELVNSSHLKKLGLKIYDISIIRLSGLSSLSIASTKWHSQEDLKILFSSCHQLLKLSYNGVIQDILPEWQHFPLNLTKLTLIDCILEEDPMLILEKLPNLRILRLGFNSLFGRSSVCSSKGFPKLQTLILCGLPNLEEWTVDEEAMPNLSKLNIKYCQKLKMIPEGIKFITTLRHLEIKDMLKEFKDRIRDVDGKEGEDFYKVRHVPSIIMPYTYTP